MKRRFLIFALLATVALAEDHGSRGLLWVKYDAETKTAKLSNGEPLTQPITPGQIVGTGRQGLRALREWRPPQDIIIAYKPAQANRVAFSHERHFAALGAKNCKVCHDEQKGLGQKKTFPSLANKAAVEPHAEKSVGRFCANCHRGNFKSAQIPDAKPPVNLVIFTSFGKTGDSGCAHCHAPADHRTDFMSGHGDRAEHGAARCASCHRGASAITPAELAQAQQFQQAQLALIKNSDDTAAFQGTLPNNFCAYCHGIDRTPWRGGERGGHGGRSERGGRGD